MEENTELKLVDLINGADSPYNDYEGIMAQNINGELQKCLNPCQQEEFSAKYDSVEYPNSNTFKYRPDFCYVYRKMLKVCKSPLKRHQFEKWASWTLCDDLIESHQVAELCLENDILTEDKADHTSITNFVTEYTKQNVIDLRIFIKRPYYTKIRRDVQISSVTFIGSTGGLVGLGIGLSFVSVFEMFYHFINFVTRITLKSK